MIENASDRSEWLYMNERPDSLTSQLQRLYHVYHCASHFYNIVAKLEVANYVPNNPSLSDLARLAWQRRIKSEKNTGRDGAEGGGSARRGKNKMTEQLEQLEQVDRPAVPPKKRRRGLYWGLT